MTTRKDSHADSQSQPGGKASGEWMFTVPEVAALLSVHPDTVRRWSSAGLLRTYRLGRRGDRRFAWEDIDSFIKQRGESANLLRPQKGKVLVVDDDHRVRDLLKDAIEKQGYEAIAVGDGERALEEIEKQDFDLIFLDLVLSGLSGVDVLRTIELKDTRAAVAVVTGYGDDPIALEAMSLGAFVFIRKPFDMAHVIEVLRLTMSAKPWMLSQYSGESGRPFAAIRRRIRQATFEPTAQDTS